MTDIINFIDAPDPDNFLQVLAAHRLFPRATQHVVLTGRPVRFQADKSVEHWQWDQKSSQMALEASAMRLRNFMRHFSVDIPKVYNGGIAPRTLVPHWIHFEEYYKFCDVDPLAALRHSELEPQEDIVADMLKMDEIHVLVGGPMTGLHQLIQRNPDITANFKSLHSMFATWGEVELMKLDDKQPRGASQFNVACDPFAAYCVLNGLTCPIYMVPSECTRFDPISFETAQDLRKALPNNAATNQLCNLYAIWYDAAVKPRGDRIYIHDLCSALSLYDMMNMDGDASQPIYDYMNVDCMVPHLATEKDKWGTITMEEVLPTDGPGHESNIFCAKEVSNADRYLSLLSRICE